MLRTETRWWWLGSLLVDLLLNLVELPAQVEDVVKRGREVFGNLAVRRSAWGAESGERWAGAERTTAGAAWGPSRGLGLRRRSGCPFWLREASVGRRFRG